MFRTLLIAGLALPAAAQAQSDEDLAKQLANPVASLISVPFQNNYDCCFGPDDGYRYTLNVQPVIPLSLNADWEVITRTIVPIIHQERTSPVSGEESGFGDVTQSFFFSPRAAKGLIWGVGPAILWPLGDAPLGAEKWAAGPTALVLKEQGPHTYGLLANHLWSFAGEDDRPAVVTTFLQPFYNHTYPNSTGVLINSEASFDWKRDEWTVPVNFGVSHVYTFGPQRVSMALVGRYFLERPDDGPEWGARFVVTLIYPKT